MHMKDWTGYRSKIVETVGELAKLSPDTVRGYTTLGGAGGKTDHLDAKTRELIALAVAVALRCDGCIAVHTEAARKLGLRKEEIAEALGVAIAISAGAAVVYSTRTLPLKPGTYVLTGSPCADHANAAEFSYDGHAFSYPHASQCLSKLFSKRGKAYRIATTCSAAGDGSPTPPVTITSTYRLSSSTKVDVRQADDKAASAYRRCPAV